MLCPVCCGKTVFFRKVSEFDFFKCSACKLIHLSDERLERIDNGEVIRSYENDYWSFEVKAAAERARGPGIARMCEAIYLASTPVRSVLDIGTGPGTLLDTMAQFMPYAASSIHGVELFPPPPEWRTTSPNYHIGSMDDLAPCMFEAGLCMEVIEHLTPRMMRGLLRSLTSVASEGSCFVFNTGLASFVENEDPCYLDPTVRGHITIWTVEAVARLAEPFGLTATALPGREWAFIVEKGSGFASIEHRLHHPLPENLAFLSGGEPIEAVPSMLARSGIAWFLYADLAMARTQWALSLKALLEAAASK